MIKLKKYIITDQENVIIHISDTIAYQKNGNVLVDNDTLAIAKYLVKKVYEVENITDDITINKYCYTVQKGFYVNENYVEPKEIVSNEELQEQINDLQKLLDTAE